MMITWLIVLRGMANISATRTAYHWQAVFDYLFRYRAYK